MIARQPVTVLAAKGKATAAKGFGAAKPGQAGQKGIAVDAPCPCGSSALYQGCCGPYHAAPATVPSPEALLRSRYSAYAAKDPSFIADTTHPDSAEYTGSRTTYQRAVKQTMARLDPLALQILSSSPGADENEAFITFRLKRRIRDPEAPKNAPEVDEVTERSRFVRVNGRWFFQDSEFPEPDGAAPAAAAAKEPEAAPKKKGLLPFF
ncbi:hypothetical protein GPECTOR_12g367 [Gonium pectorale]|uniref:YchJ-like middle NTF2-like domain-containing protein n=1 Tax=Gonium pectorale TaxID=33097 RepID=A0A150GNQ1_GONPE|nr:hypothetical protein GPECTOR_12g367 [Gonium pectorale]|eukprot:KXZ51405.1 hypothetical protein GPECTOR_12g367 [Gonium pectorale]